MTRPSSAPDGAPRPAISPNSSSTSWPEAFASTAGIVLLLLGATVLAGWHLHSQAIVQLRAGFAPMQYNTALCFFFSGLALLGGGAKSPRISFAASTFVALVALLTFSEYVLAKDLGIDNLVLKPAFTQGRFPGRPAPATAGMFILCAGGLIVQASKLRPRVADRIVWYIASVTIPVCSIAAIGYAANLNGAYTMSGFTGVALLTAVGLMVLTAALLARTLRDRPLSWMARERGLPAAAGVAVTTATLILWQALLTERQNHLREASNVIADGLQSQLSERMEARLRALERMAKRWEKRGEMPRTEWEDDAAAYITDEKGFQAIEWVDAAFQLQWIVPVGGNATLQELELPASAQRHAAMTEARDRKYTTISPVLDLSHGGKGFLAYVPLHPNGQFKGLITAVFRFDILLDSLLAGTGTTDYAVALYDGEQWIHSLALRSTESTTNIQGESTLNFHGNKWRLVATPTAGLIDRTSSNLPHLTLIVGLALAGVVLVTVRSTQVAHLKAREIDAINRQLGRQIAVHTQTEIMLRESEDRFRQAFAVAGIGMSLVGLDGRWLRVNRALCELVGYSEGELLARTFQDITHPDDLDADLGHVRKLIAGEASDYQMEKRYFHRDGHIIWIRLTVSLIRSVSGQPVHFVSQIEDISERYRVNRPHETLNPAAATQTSPSTKPATAAASKSS